MSKWYQGIVVNHKEEEGKLSHWFDDENYKILCEERVEQLKEIDRLKSIIKEVREYLESIETDYAIGCWNKEEDEFIDVKKDILDILDKENK